jgi:hypothetical protein
LEVEGIKEMEDAVGCIGENPSEHVAEVFREEGRGEAETALARIGFCAKDNLKTKFWRVGISIGPSYYGPSLSSLSFSQTAMWTLDTFHTGRKAYNIHSSPGRGCYNSH